MGTGLEQSTTADEPISASSSKGETSTNNKNNNSDNNDAGDFECNICFDLAQDPIVTLCGHLFCWPCLYRWLHHHSQSQECPVCKALVQEDRLVPLYGRGKSTSDPRSRPIPDFEIPNRPSGQRPETAPPAAGAGADQGYLPNLGFGFLGGFMPMASARIGNMTMSAGFGGLLPGLLSFQFNGFLDSTTYGAAHAHGHGFQYGFPPSPHGNGIHHRHGHGFHNHERGSSQVQDNHLKNLLLFIAFVVLLAMLWS